MLGDSFSEFKDFVPRNSRDQNNPQTSIQQGNSFNTESLLPKNQNSAIMGLKIQQFASSICRQSCSCQCHTRRQWRSYQFLDQLLGTLFIGYSNTPRTTLSCDLMSCNRHQRNITTLFYVFPHWLLWHIWSVVLIHTRRDGLAASLRTFRNRRPSDRVFFCATTGDIVKLRALFNKGEASPSDIDGGSQLDLLTVRIISFIMGIEIHKITVCHFQRAN